MRGGGGGGGGRNLRGAQNRRWNVGRGTIWKNLTTILAKPTKDLFIAGAFKIHV